MVDPLIPEHRELTGGYVEGSEEVDPVDDLVTARSGQGPIVGAVDGSSGSSYRGNPWDQVRDLETRIQHARRGVWGSYLVKLIDQWGESLIVFRLEIKAVRYLYFQ